MGALSTGSQRKPKSRIVSETPFATALGPLVDELPSPLRAHFAMSPGVRRYRGLITRVWRRQGVLGHLIVPFLWLASSMDTLFPETGNDVPFELENRVVLR